MIRVVFETHSTTLDNERGVASGWLDSTLSTTGRERARALGTRTRARGIDVAFVSDLGRALESAAIALDGARVPQFVDWRLRECNYGELNGHPASAVHGARLAHLDVPYPGGESYRNVVARVGWFLDDLGRRWDGAHVLVIGHSATRYALDRPLGGTDLASVLGDPGEWRPG